jgi:hypothetical protein
MTSQLLCFLAIEAFVRIPGALKLPESQPFRAPASLMDCAGKPILVASSGGRATNWPPREGNGKYM